jgi:hypothetical protein
MQALASVGKPRPSSAATDLDDVGRSRLLAILSRRSDGRRDKPPRRCDLAHQVFITNTSAFVKGFG